MTSTGSNSVIESHIATTIPHHPSSEDQEEHKDIGKLEEGGGPDLLAIGDRSKAPIIMDRGGEDDHAPHHYKEVDITRQRFPHCIVWTPIPLLTWIAPFIGHMGIADRRGM